MSTPNMPKDAGGMSGERLEDIRRLASALVCDPPVFEGSVSAWEFIDNGRAALNDLLAELARVEGELGELKAKYRTVPMSEANEGDTVDWCRVLKPIPAPTWTLEDD